MESNRKISKQQNWDRLPQDMVIFISSKLSSCFLDILSLRGVCSSWRIAMTNRPRIAYPMLALLAQSQENNFTESINEFSLFAINEKRRYKFRNTQLHSTSRVIGNHPNGWVIFFGGQFREVYLLHLFLKIHIQLPNKVGSTGRSKIDNIRKAILSANDVSCMEKFIVVMSFHHPTETKLAIWRYGDRHWKSFGGECFVFDVAFYHNRIFAIRGNSLCENDRHLQVWDVKSNPSLPEQKFCIPMSDKPRIDQRVLALSANEVLIVDHNYKSDCVIEKLDLSKLEWVKVTSLKGQTLLWCSGDSVLVHSSIHADAEPLEFKPNSIYFVSQQRKLIMNFTIFDLGMYRLQGSQRKLIWNLVREANLESSPATFWVVLTM